jgi:hypothetical protein
LIYDAPNDVIQFELDRSFELGLNEKNTSYVTEYYNYRNATSGFIVVDFFAKDKQTAGSLSIYASDTTGKPSEKKHEAKAVGQEPVQLVLSPVRALEYHVTYFTITPGSSKMNVSVATLDLIGSKNVDITPTTPAKIEVNCAADHSFIVFTVPKVAKGSHLKFAATTSADIQTKIGVYHNPNKNIRYPTPTAAKNANEGPKSAVLIVDDEGDVRFGVYVKYLEYPYKCSAVISAEVKIN